MNRAQIVKELGDVRAYISEARAELDALISLRDGSQGPLFNDTALNLITKLHGASDSLAEATEALQAEGADHA